MRIIFKLVYMLYIHEKQRIVVNIQRQDFANCCIVARFILSSVLMLYFFDFNGTMSRLLYEVDPKSTIK